MFLLHIVARNNYFCCFHSSILIKNFSARGIACQLLSFSLKLKYSSAASQSTNIDLAEGCAGYFLTDTHRLLEAACVGFSKGQADESSNTQ